MSVKVRAHLLLLAVVIVWGATFTVVKNALTDISPLLFNLLRMTLAFACLSVFYHRHLRTIARGALMSGATVGFFLAMGYQFQTAGLALTTPSKSAFITGLAVVLVPLLSVFPALRPAGLKAPRWNAYAGALLAFAGIILLTAPGAVALNFSAVNRGDLLSLGCALGYALHVLAVAHALPRVRYEQLAVLQVGFCMVFMAVSTPLLERPHLHLTTRLVIALMVASVLATAAAFTIQSWAQQHLQPTHIIVILALEPVVAWLTSFFVLGQGLDPRGSIGALLILAAIAVTEFVPASIQPTAHEGVPVE